MLFACKNDIVWREYSHFNKGIGMWKDCGKSNEKNFQIIDSFMNLGV